jgi:hypothetical protein
MYVWVWERKTKSLSDWHYQAIFEMDLLVMHFTLRAGINSYSIFKVSLAGDTFIEPQQDKY